MDKGKKKVYLNSDILGSKTLKISMLSINVINYSNLKKIIYLQFAQNNDSIIMPEIYPNSQSQISLQAFRYISMTEGKSH